MQHQSSNRKKKFVSKAEQAELLCRNKDSDDCSVLDFIDSTTQRKLLLDQFAGIIVEMYLEAKGYKSNAEKRSDVLPRINKGTS